MSKKLCLLITFVLLFSLVGSASAAAKFDYRVCWWSDLGPGHDWNEPNNWYTMDRYWGDVDNDDVIDILERKYYVKVHPNQVPDVNTVVFIGKGNAGVDYPEFLHFNPPAVDPTISSGTVVAVDVMCSGGYSLDPNKVGGGAQGCVDHGDPNHWDPCLHHELTITDGTLNIGEPQSWEGYDTLYGYGYFSGMYSGSSLLLGTVGWYPPELGPGKGQGTMNMSGDSIVNVGGNMGLGGWEQTIGTLNMTGGTININQGLCCPLYPWGATGRLNLRGGTINARYIFMNDSTGSDSGSIDVAGGKFILSRGDEVEELTDYSNGIGLYGAGSVSLTAYGVGHGGIVTDDVNFPDAVGQRAALSIDYDASNEAKTTVQAFLTDPDQAWAPSPPDGAGSVKGTVANIARPVLSWSPGDNAASHAVYFGNTFADVNGANTTSDECQETAYDPCNWTVDSDLASFGTYFWRIDENPGPVKGQVWSFTMANLSKASLPNPTNGETEVNPVVNLGWAEGIYAVTHEVYFSSDFNEVNDRSISPVNTGATNSYDPPGNGLDFSTTFFWRVDECNDAVKPEWPGDVWSFTTHDRIIVETFDSYGRDEDLWAVWKDYHADTDNKAEIFVVTDPNRTAKSMKFKLLNTHAVKGTLVGSWAEAATTDLEAGGDWTASGVEVLTLYFYGDPCNGQDTTGLDQDQMYVALEDGSTTEGVGKYPDMNAIKEAFWHEWNIELQDFNAVGVVMSDVSKVYLGFGGPRVGQKKAGAGMDWGYPDIVHFEDIELWPPKCIPSLTFSYGDFTGDCVIDLDDAEVMFNDWLVTDYNSLGYTGTLTGFAGPGEPNYDNCWVTGKVDSNTALYFNLGGTPTGDEYVKTPPLNLNTNTVTFTCWAKRHGVQRDDAGLFFCSHLDDGPGTTQSGFVIGLSGDANNASLHYNWQNAQPTYSWDPAIPVLPEDEWAFCALVVSPTWARIYIRRETDLITDLWSEQNDTTHDPEAFGIPSRIGDHKARKFVGVIDDFRIYDKSLTPSEVQYLATFGAYGADPTNTNLYAHYKLDDATGLTALDDAGDMVNWWPVPSQANFVDPEPEGQRAVNFRDFQIVADNWLEVKLWP